MTPQDEDADSLIPALLAIYANYLSYRSATDALPTAWQEVSQELQLATFIEDALALIAARALARQREGRGPAADALWQGTASGVQAGVRMGLQTVAEALLWTEHHPDEEIGTKDVGGRVPTLSSPPTALALAVAVGTASAAQEEAARYAGWRYKVWETVGDDDVRASHAVLNGKKVRINDSFRSGSGAVLRFPGDPAAPFEERIGCRCTLATSR